MNTIDLSSYGPIISDETKGKEIFDAMCQLLSNNNSIIVDMKNVKSMATFCARQIFGKLYLKLGASDFYNRVAIKNATDDLKTIIRLGIESEIAKNEN